jgi:hypothetical protein
VGGARVSLLKAETYIGSNFDLPPGSYALFFDVRIHAYTKANNTKGMDMLGVMMTCFPLAGGDPHHMFLGLGKKAIGAYMPDPNTPAWNSEGSTGLVPVAGAAAVNLSDMTNWGQFFKSLRDCCELPPEANDDLSIMDGIWVDTQNVVEPETRKNLKAKTAVVEGQQEEDRGPKMIPNVVRVHDDGMPWLGGGGMPEAASAPVAAPPKAVAKTALKPTAAKATRPAPVAAPPPEPEPAAAEETATEGAPEGVDPDLWQAAVDGMASALGEPKLANGATKTLVRMSTVKAVTKVHGEDMAAQVIATFFDQGDEWMNLVANVLGYGVQGTFIKPLPQQ